MSTSGTNHKQITELNAQKNLGITILQAKDHAEAFLMVDTGRSVAFVMDDILLYSLVANSKNPSEWAVSGDPISVEPYGIMLRRDDASFKKVVDTAMANLYKSGEINKIYEKWFLKPVPPKGINLNLPMSGPFKTVVANPTDSGDRRGTRRAGACVDEPRHPCATPWQGGHLLTTPSTWPGSAAAPGIWAVAAPRRLVRG